MKILVTGNKGSFSKEIANLISRKYEIEFFQIDKDLNILKTQKKINNILKKNNYKFVVYLGGETRNKNLMKIFNIDLVIKISKLCKEFNLTLIYLSSLAVFGIPNNKNVTLLSQKLPFNYYGQSKNYVDNYLKENIYKNHIFSLLPASIISDSENNFYVKLKKFMRYKIIKIIFYLLCPGGQFNFCYSDDIAKEIIKIIKSNPERLDKDILPSNKFHEIFISNGLYIKEIFYEANNFFPIFTLPSLNIKLVKMLFFYLSPKLLLRMIFLLSKVSYKKIDSNLIK